MATNTPFSNILPDPANPINDAGQASSADSAPGFSTVSLRSVSKTTYNSTNSGRLITSSSGGHKWQITAEYNPLTRDDFEPVHNFLLQKKGRFSAFFMSLPQNASTRNSAFNVFVSSNDNFKMYTSPVNWTTLELHREYKVKTGSSWSTVGSSSDTVNTVFTATGAAGTGTNLATPTYEPAGQDTITISNTLNSYDRTTHGLPRPGDLFTVEDTNDALHTKLYKITRVETPEDYAVSITQQGSNSEPSENSNVANSIRLHFIPALQRNLYAGASIKFHDPKVRVVLTNDVQEYSLNSENLYSFSLQLEEAQK